MTTSTPSRPLIVRMFGRVLRVQAPADDACAVHLSHEFPLRLARITGFCDIDGPTGDGTYAVRFGERCGLIDDELAAAVRRCAILSATRNGDGTHDPELLCTLALGSQLAAVKTGTGEIHLAPDATPSQQLARALSADEVQTVCNSDLSETSLHFGTLTAAAKFGAICTACAERVALTYCHGSHTKAGAAYCPACAGRARARIPLLDRAAELSRACTGCREPLRGVPVDPFAPTT